LVNKLKTGETISRKKWNKQQLIYFNIYASHSTLIVMIIKFGDNSSTYEINY